METWRLPALWAVQVPRIGSSWGPNAPTTQRLPSVRWGIAAEKARGEHGHLGPPWIPTDTRSGSEGLSSRRAAGTPPGPVRPASRGPATSSPVSPFSKTVHRPVLKWPCLYSRTTSLATGDPRDPVLCKSMLRVRWKLREMECECEGEEELTSAVPTGAVPRRPWAASLLLFGRPGLKAGGQECFCLWSSHSWPQISLLRHPLRKPLHPGMHRGGDIPGPSSRSSEPMKVSQRSVISEHTGNGQSSLRQPWSDHVGIHRIWEGAPMGPWRCYT